MPTVFIPPLLRPLTKNVDRVEIRVSTLRSVVDELDRQFPGFRERVCQDGEFRPELSVAINGNVATQGLSQAIRADDEVHFLPALGGG